MKREDLPQRGDTIYLTMPMQPLPQRDPASSFAPIALEMRIDLLKAKIKAETEAQYTPAELEYQRRLLETARLRTAYRH